MSNFFKKMLDLQKDCCYNYLVIGSVMDGQEEVFWSVSAVTTGRQREISSLTTMQNLTNVTDVTIKPTYLIRRKEKL